MSSNKVFSGPKIYLKEPGLYKKVIQLTLSDSSYRHLKDKPAKIMEVVERVKEALEQLIQSVESCGYNVVYVDFDTVFVQTNKSLEEITKKLMEIVANPVRAIEWKQVCFFSKKQYVGVPKGQSRTIYMSGLRLGTTGLHAKTITEGKTI